MGTKLIIWQRKLERAMSFPPVKFAFWLVNIAIGTAIGIPLGNWAQPNADKLLYAAYAIVAVLLLMAATFSVAAWWATVTNRRAPRFDYHGLQGDNWAKLFSVSQEIIENAQREILALNAWTEERADGHENQESQDARAAYFATLIKRSAKVKYRRILQADISANYEDIYSQYVEHFAAMEREAKARIGDHEAKEIELSIVVPRVPATFLIVDEEWLVWQLNRLDSQGIAAKVAREGPNAIPGSKKQDRFRMRAVIVVHDPEKLFIQHFIDTFNEAAGAKHTKLVPKSPFEQHENASGGPKDPRDGSMQRATPAKATGSDASKPG